MDPQTKKSLDGLPGVSAGKTVTPGMAGSNTPDPVSGLPSDKNAAEKSVIQHGGNKGGRPRNDGLVPGSVEALQADRQKDAERKRRARADASANRISAPLPSANAPQPSNVPSTSGVETVFNGDAGGGWFAEDFKFASADSISFVESWRVKSKTDKAIKGNLPVMVADEIGKSFAFPDEIKTSLRTSLPDGLAKAFNWLKIPVTVKPLISCCPGIAYLIIRDFQQDAKLDKMIADESGRRKTAEQIANQKTN